MSAVPAQVRMKQRLMENVRSHDRYISEIHSGACQHHCLFFLLKECDDSLELHGIC